jgi:DNA invertase Pin-like site-specific DNA recombinase
VASGEDDRRPGFQPALARCRQLGAVSVAARLVRITRRAHTLSQLPEVGVAIRAADMPGADELALRIYAAMAQKERELISAHTKAARAPAKARGAVLGGDRGWRPLHGPEGARRAWRARTWHSGRHTAWCWRSSGCKPQGCLARPRSPEH